MVDSGKWVLQCEAAAAAAERGVAELELFKCLWDNGYAMTDPTAGAPPEPRTPRIPGRASPHPLQRAAMQRAPLQRAPLQRARLRRPSGSSPRRPPTPEARSSEPCPPLTLAAAARRALRSHRRRRAGLWAGRLLRLWIPGAKGHHDHRSGRGGLSPGGAVR